MKKIILYFLLLIVFNTEYKSQSITNIDSLKEVYYNNKKEDTLKLRQSRKICFYYSNNSIFDSVFKYAFNSLAMAKKNKFPFWEASFHNVIGVTYWNKGNYKEAIKHYEKGLKCQEENNDSTLISTFYNNLGLAYWEQSNLPKALELYLRSLDIDSKQNYKKGMTSSYLNIGLIYSDMKDYKSALQNYFKSLVLCKELNDNDGLVNNYINIGQVYANIKNYQTSMHYDLMALELCKKTNDKSLLALIHNNIGNLHSIEKKDSLALSYFLIAYNYYKEIGNLSGLVLVLNNIGDAYINLKKTKVALVSLGEALLLEQELELINEESKTRALMAKAYENLGDYKNAFYNLDLHKKLVDSTSTMKNANLINQMQKTHEIKQKETELNLQKEKELAIKEAEKQKQTYVTIGIIVILALTVIFSFFLYKRFKLTNSQKQIIEKQKHLVEEKQKEIVDSITYAKRIQNTLLANKEMMDVNLPENFVLFKPKDIVSGDFYWITESNKYFYLAVCDSTGHGVPGAFMSLLNIGFLSEAINEKDISNPNEVFNYARKRLVNSISKDGQQDGFDGILLRFNSESQKYSYAAANNSPVIISNGILTELAADKMPVGKGERNETFVMHEINAQKGDMLYLYTDGFADQFGGPKGKKFKYKQLNDLLLTNASKPLHEQKQILDEVFEKWRGNLEQIDDVCIIGIRI